MYQSKGKPKVKKNCPVCHNAMRVQKVTKYMRYWKCLNCNTIYAHEVATDRLVTKIERYDYE